MKKNQPSKSATNRHSGKSFSRRRSGRCFPFEQLEDRRVLAPIQWANRADFDNEFGANTAAAREIIDRALLDWGAVIESFNYRNVGQSGWSPNNNTYTLNISVKDLPKGTLAEGGPRKADQDGKPFSGEMNIDIDGSGTGWNWDATPADDYEFTTPQTPFAATGGPAGTDLYSIVLHELGHALGIADNVELPIQNRIRNHAFTLNDGNQVHFVDNPKDDNTRDEHIDPLFHMRDLMVPKLGKSERRVISDLDARLLGEAFGYTIDLRPVYARSFITTYNQALRKLTVHGDLGTTFNTALNDDAMYLNVMADDIFVSVNGYNKIWSTASVSNIEVVGGHGGDDIGIEATRAGMPVTVNAGKGQNTVTLSPGLKNLLHIQGNIDVLQDGGNTKLYFNDDNNTQPREIGVFDADVQFADSARRVVHVRYSGYANTAQNIDQLVLRGGSGGNLLTVANDAADQTFTHILAGAGNDTVRVISLGKKGGEINGVSGTDTVTVGSDTVQGLRDVLGPLRVDNPGGWTDLTYNDSADPSRSGNLNIYADRITGLGPGVMYYGSSSGIPNGIKTLNVRASSHSTQGNVIKVVDTRQNRADDLVVNLTTGKNNDRVSVERTQSRLNIDGQAGADRVNVGTTGIFVGNINRSVTVDSEAGTIALSIDNSLDATERELFVSDSALWILSSFVFYNELKLTSLAFTGGSRKTTADVFDTPQNIAGTLQTSLEFGVAVDDVTVRATTGALQIEGRGEHDNVTIGDQGRLNGIKGAIDIRNSGTSVYTNVLVDGSEETAPVNNGTIDATSVRGFTTADITLQQQRLNQLVVNGGKGGNTITVVNTPQNAIESVGVIVNSGAGVDTVNVRRTRSNTTINGQASRDTVNIGRAGNTQSINKNLYITNANSHSTINLDDSNDTVGRDVALDVALFPVLGMVGTVEGLAPGFIFFKQTDLLALNIWGSDLLDVYRVRNTALSGVLGGSPTTIHGGINADTFRVTATTGDLIIDPQGSNNLVTLGSAGGPGGSLTNLRGKVSVVGEGGDGNFLEIVDRDSIDSYTYTMDGARLTRTNLTGTGPAVNLEFGEYTVVGMNFIAANNGNLFDILGTLNSVPTYPGGGIQIYTGDGNDQVNVFGAGSGQVNIDLGAGAIQRIQFGTATHSLNNLYSNFVVTGRGFIDAFVTNAAETRSQQILIDAQFSPSGNSQLVKRQQFNVDHFDTLNEIRFQPTDPSRLNYSTGQGGDVTFVRGSVPNVSVIVSGSSAPDIFWIENQTAPLLGPVEVVGNRADGDYAYYFDYGVATPQNYTFSVAAGKQVVSRTGVADVTYAGISQLIFYTSVNGGSRVVVQSVALDLFLNSVVEQNDFVNIGNFGDVSGIAGPVSVSGVGNNIRLVLDDGESSQDRDATLHPANETGFESISGLSPGEIRWRLDATGTVDVLGGFSNDTYAIDGLAFTPSIRIDAGLGANALDYSNAPVGIQVHLPTGTATGMTGGVSNIQNVIGSAFDDILTGTGGNLLTGGGGRDILIAGHSASTLQGGDADDVLIAGFLYADDDDGELDPALIGTIATEWFRSDLDYATRVSNLRDMLAFTFIRNGAANTLLGQNDLDLFFTNLADVTDAIAGEVIA